MALPFWYTRRSFDAFLEDCEEDLDDKEKGASMDDAANALEFADFAVVGEEEGRRAYRHPQTNAFFSLRMINDNDGWRCCSLGETRKLLDVLKRHLPN